MSESKENIVTVNDVSRLRKASNAGMMDCKKALLESNGDFDKAMEILRKKGQAIAANRATREASEGCVLALADNTFAAIIALKCETDFVAKNEEFIALTKSILDTAVSKKLLTIENLLRDADEINGKTIQERITEYSGISGEKVELTDYVFIEGASTASYIHSGNKLATIAAFNQATIDKQVAHDIAIQIAAMNPIAISPEDVSKEIIDSEIEIAMDKARQMGKPESLLHAIAQGSLHKYFEENTLLQQRFTKDTKQSIKEYLYVADKELTVTDFKRISLK